MAVSGQDIGLLFGVLGGGRISGESGALIKSQLDSIVASLNNATNSKQRRIKLNLDIAGTKSSFSTGLKQITNGLSGQKQFKIKVSEIDATSAINKLKSQLDAMLKTLSVKNGMTITMPLADGGSIVGDAGSQALEEAKVKAAEYAAQLASIKTIGQSVSSAVKGAMTGNGAIAESEALKGVISDYNKWLQKVEELKASKQALHGKALDDLQAEGVAIVRNIERIREEQRAREEASRASETSDDAYARRISRLNALQKSAATALGYTAAKHTEQYRNIEIANAELQEMATNYTRLTDADLDRLSAQINSNTAQIRSMNLASKSFGDTLLANAKKFTSWLGVSRIIMMIYNSLRKMVVAVKDVDTAMTELRKVTNETEASYISFLEKATSRARELGATISDTVSASADFARLGYSLDDAAMLADAALVYKNVGDGIEDVGTASESIISTMRAFGIEAEGAMFIVDKFNEVGNNFAISSKGVGDALLRSASALAAGNNTLDESIALVTAANSVVQDADKVGTTMKTISMFLRAAKTEAEEAGESTEGMANSVSELRGEILALTGGKVDIQIDEDTFKSTYQIIKELSEVWDELTDISQANILEMIGGKRNSNVVAALLTNFQTAEEVIKTAANASGSALAENEKYLDSINGKVAQFKAAFEELSLNIFDSEMVKGVVDFGTGLLDVLNALAKINALLPVTVALVTTIITLRRVNQASAMASSIVYAVSRGLSAESEEVKALTISYGALTAARQKDVIAVVSARLAQQGLTKEEIAAKLATLGLTAATGGQTAANYSLAASFKAVLLSNPFGWIALALSLLPGLISWVKSLNKSVDELEEEYSELATTVNDAASSFRSLKKEADQTIPRFVELAKGVDKFGKNVSLTDEEYAEFLELNNRIAEMFPEINMGMDSNGNAMLALSYSADTLTDSLMALVEAERAAANAEIAKTMPDILTNIDETNDAYREQIRDLEDIQDEYEEVYEDILNRSLPTDIGRYSTMDAGYAAAQEFIKKAQELGMHGAVYVDNQQSTNNGYVFKVEWDYSALDVAPALNMPYIEDQYNIAIERYEKQINDFEARMKAKWAQLNPVVGSWLQTDFMFQDLNGQMQEIAETMVSGIDFSELGLTTQEEVQQYVDDNIVEPLFLAAPDVKEAFAQITDWREQLANGELSEDDFASKVTEAFDGIFASTLPDNAEAFKQIFVAAFNEMGIAGSDFGSVLAGLIDEWTGNTEVAATYSAELSVLTDTISALQESYDLLAKAQEEMSGGGGLSIDTIEALAKAEENYLDYLYEENGVIKLNTEAWKENANAKMSGDIAEIQKEIAALQEERAALQADLAEYEANRQLGNDGGIWSSLIAETTTKLEENSAAILENQGLLALYSSIYGDITGELDAYSAALNNFANIANTIDTVSDSFATLANLQAEVADGFTISLEKALEFASVYPEILNSATATSDGQIALNEGVVNSFITGKKAELDAQVDAEIAKLEADKAVLTAKMQSAQAQLELAKNVGEGEGQIAKEVAEYRINTGNALTAALIEMGVEESKAHALAAAAMAENEEEFARVAKECFENMDENAAKAAYNMAHSIFVNASNSCDSIADIAQQAHDTARAIAAMGNGEVAGSGVSQFDGADGTTTGGLSLDLYKGDFKGSDYDYEANTIDLDEYVAQIELDISAYENAIAQIDGQIATLQALKNLPLKSFVSDTTSGSKDSDSKEVEEYVADIEKYREALERLNDVRIKKADLELELENAEDLDEQIRIEKELLGVYRAEQECLEEINGLRDETIANGVKALEQLGFQIDYDPDNNKFFVKNLEHLNDLTADSVGKYGSLQEATNALRKDTEELIDTLEELNAENQEDQDTWQELYHTIREAKINIVNNLKEIVSQASEAVDEIQNVYDTLKDAADEYAANGGFISVDAFQAIVELGPEYMQYLRDENGLLVINEEAINRVIAAKTEQLALESAMSYIERLRLALQTESIEDLNTLLYATVENTNATWGLVYANLALLDLNSDQYQAALHNINAIRALADNAIQGIGRTAGTVEENLTEMKQGLDDILKYVMDMLRHRIEQQIDALEEMKDAYGELIELKKESMEATKEETDYQDEVAEKIKQIAKLQERINALSLDDSRDAQAQKAQLQEEMAELQKELADTQADYAYDTQQDSLDKMQEAYEAEKDKEIEILEESISSEQKLYEMAISYIQSNWDTLYQELIAWNTEYGSVLNSEITTAWDNCLAAAQRYGSYVSALNNIDADIESAGGGGNNITVGNTNYDSSSSKEENIEAIINEMWRNSRAHHSASTEQKAYLNKRNLTLGAMLAQYGITAVRGDDGVWYIDRVGGQQLYDKYKKYCYHQGGIVGDEGTLKENEVLAKLERGEVMISNRNKGTLFSLIEFVDMLSKKLDVASMGTMERPFIKDAKPDLSNITNNQSETIHFGDVYIYGADEQTVEKHREVTRQFTNEVLKQLNIKR